MDMAPEGAHIVGCMLHSTVAFAHHHARSVVFLILK